MIAITGRVPTTGKGAIKRSKGLPFADLVVRRAAGVAMLIRIIGLATGIGTGTA